MICLSCLQKRQMFGVVTQLRKVIPVLYFQRIEFLHIALSAPLYIALPAVMSSSAALAG